MLSMPLSLRRFRRFVYEARGRAIATSATPPTTAAPPAARSGALLDASHPKKPSDGSTDGVGDVALFEDGPDVFGGNAGATPGVGDAARLAACW
jgi:hypothetical protein